jgi:hypothetical protein
MDKFKHQKSAVKTTVSDQFDISCDLFDGVLIVSGEISGDADQAGCAPIDVFGYLRPELLHHEPLEFLPVIKEPVEVKQSLIDYVLIHGPLEFENDRAVVLVKSECIDAATVHRPS